MSNFSDVEIFKIEPDNNEEILHYVVKWYQEEADGGNCVRNQKHFKIFYTDDPKALAKALSFAKYGLSWEI